MISNKRIYKEWRSDINKWEERKLLVGIIPYYVYSAWPQASVRLFKKRRSTSKYYKVRELGLVDVSCQELQDEYRGNKWLIPINKILNCK